MSGILIAGEDISSLGAISTLTYHRPGRGRGPLLLFLPGGGHLARIAYGYPGGSRRDFLDHWLEAEGLGLLAVSPPSGLPFGTSHPELNRSEWAAAIAAHVSGILNEAEASRSVAILAWSMASGFVDHLALALRARGVSIHGFIPIAASPPLVRPSGIYETTERIREDGLWDVAGSTVAGVERAKMWLDEIAAIERELGRSVLPPQAYRRHVLVPTPGGLRRGGVAGIAASVREPDMTAFPLAAPIVPAGQGDCRHGLGDFAGWGHVNAQLVLARYAAAVRNGWRPADQVWNRLLTLVDQLPSRLGARLPGGHFFFLGETGARATAATIVRLLGASSEVMAEIDALIPVAIDQSATSSQT